MLFSVCFERESWYFQSLHNKVVFSANLRYSLIFKLWKFIDDSFNSWLLLMWKFFEDWFTFFPSLFDLFNIFNLVNMVIFSWFRCAKRIIILKSGIINIYSIIFGILLMLARYFATPSHICRIVIFRWIVSLFHYKEIIVEKTGFIFKETLIKGVDDRNITPMSLVFIIAGILSESMFGEESIWRH